MISTIKKIRTISNEGQKNMICESIDEYIAVIEALGCYDVRKCYEDDAGDYIFAKFDEDGETKEVAIFYAPYDEEEYKNGLCITLVELW